MPFYMEKLNTNRKKRKFKRKLANVSRERRDFISIGGYGFDSIRISRHVFLNNNIFVFLF